MELDKQQMKIVNSTAKDILIIAGAGSGKTRVLTERIKHLIVDEHVPAKHIIAITFTNMAADEMLDRLKDAPCIKEAFIGTIHSLANKIYTGSKKSYQLMTEEVELLIWEEVLKKYPDLTYKRLCEYFDLRKKAAVGKIDWIEAERFLTKEEHNVLYESVEDVAAIIKRDSIITFDQLIVEATQYFEENSRRIVHLFVDELQDIDSAQYNFIRGLNAENNFFVGDDWQAIYGFKGGNIEIFNSLVDDPAFKIYFLESNYRCSKDIIDLGLHVIKQVPNILIKYVNSVKKNNGRIAWYKKSELKTLVRLLETDKDNWRDWFVLTRTNKEAYQLADLLDDNDINYCFVRKSELTLEELQSTLKKNLVKIMTVHSAKGLESKNVILFGSFPKDIPHWFKNYNYDERKVMYVGVTRAQDNLFIFN